jgi:deoxynucleoside triphosphate triphosphohydrolase SAMHD1
MNKNRSIYDPIHKYIEFDPLLISIIDTPEFQRLRYIKQLGICYFVFSGASHNRFEHCLGVSYLCGEMIKSLKSKQEELNITDRQVILVKIAGLVHDLGHSCFSHFFDHLFLKNKLNNEDENINHEYRSGWLFEYIVKKYKLKVTKDECKFIKKLINPGKNDTGFIFDIVANKKNGLDCDKFDYIIRDSFNVGLDYSFDPSRLIKEAYVINNNICYPDKIAYNIYRLYGTRYDLHKQIYTHPCVHQIEYMLYDAMILVDDEMQISKKVYDPEEFIKLNDNLINLISDNESKSINMIKAKEIIKNIRTRKLYKMITNLLISKENIKNISKELFLDDVIKEEDIIITFIFLNYNMGSCNPVNNIKFYNKNIKDEKGNYKSFNIKKEKVSRLLPIEFEEIYLRIYCKNNKILDYANKKINNIIKKLNI